MQIPLQITYRGMSPSESLNDEIRLQIEKLEQTFDRITGCHVIVQQPHRHHRKGRHFRVQVDVTVPGEEIFVGRDPAEHFSNEDPYITVHEAFDTVRRRLKDHAQRARHEVKYHLSMHPRWSGGQAQGLDENPLEQSLG